MASAGATHLGRAIGHLADSKNGPRGRSAVFGISHVNATYEFPGGGIVFGIVVFILGVVGAYSMYKTDSLIAPILFHAGYDLTIIVPVLNSQ
jgi:membrane protease YdiL (CAAX protease family)